MPEQKNDWQQVPFNFAFLKTTFGITLKLLPFLWFAFQFYSNQAKTAESVESLKSRIVELERNSSKQDRDLVHALGLADSLQHQFDNQRQFEADTRRNRR